MFVQLARPLMVPNIPGIPGPPLGGSSSGSSSPSGYNPHSEAKMVRGEVHVHTLTPTYTQQHTHSHIRLASSVCNLAVDCTESLVLTHLLHLFAEGLSGRVLFLSCDQNESWYSSTKLIMLPNLLMELFDVAWGYCSFQLVFLSSCYPRCGLYVQARWSITSLVAKNSSVVGDIHKVVLIKYFCVLRVAILY